jgi:serine/threonine protein kinase/tetratricopeptide (TPR) repeat protein
MSVTTSIGSFDLEKPIGKGGSAVVYRARHLSSNRPVALKLLRTERADMRKLRETFWREAEAMAQLHHPQVAAVLDAGITDHPLDLGKTGQLPEGSPWLAMEYIEGRDLSDVVGLLEWNELRDILLDILDALAATHAAGILHRDLKTANILVDYDTGRLRPILVDFGIARGAVHEGQDRETERVAGTPEFMAPEQIRGNQRDEGPWTDLYALGCVAWRLVSGSPPFVRDEAKQVLKAQLAEHPPALDASSPVPDAFYDWLLWLLEKSTFQRCKRAADAALALSRLPDPSGERWGRLIGPETSDGSRREPAPLLEPDFRNHMLPESWRQAVDDVRPAQLDGAGLGLYGMRAIPVIDRDEIRAHLWRRIRQVQSEGRPLATSLVGSNGCGKSKIAEWLARTTHALGAVEFLYCTHSRRGGPSDGLGQMLARYFRCVGMERDAVRTRIERHFDRSGWDDDMAETDCDALAELIAPADRRADEKPFVRFNSPDERYLSIYRLFERICRERTIFLWADDAHWANDATAFSEFVLRHSEDNPIPLFIVGTISLEKLDERYDAYEALGRLQEHPATTRLDFEPMRDRDIETLVRHAVGLQEEFIEHVAERADGNPLFAVQIVDHWVSRGLLRPSEQGFALATDQPELPETLLQVWWERLESVFTRIGDRSREESLSALELAATLGREFDDREWERACEACEYGLQDMLIRQMASQDLLRRSGEGWAFAHALLTDALEQSAREHERWQAHHSACADVIAEMYDVSAHRVARRHAEHLIQAGRLEESLEPLERSTLQFISEGSPEESEAMLRTYEQVIDEMEVPDESKERVQYARMRARFAKGQGDIDSAREFIEPAIEKARRHDWPELLGLCLTIHGSVLLDIAEPEVANDVLREAVELLEVHGDAIDRARAHLSLAHSHRFMSELREAARACEDAAAAYLAAGQPAAAAAVRLNQATLVSGTTSDEIEDQLMEASRLANSSGDRRVMAFVALARGEFLLRAHRYSEARESYKRAAHLWASCGLKDRYAAELGQAMTALGEGRGFEVLPTLRRVRREADEAGMHFLEGEIGIGEALALFRSGEFSEARTQLDESAEYFAGAALASREFAWMCDMLAEEAFEQGRVDLACTAADLAADCWRELGEARRAEPSESRVASDD